MPVAWYPWRKLLFHGDDGSFITNTGFNFKMFQFLHGVGTALREERATEAERGYLPLRIALDWSYCGLGQE
eukprot:14516801-Ditylum_brightwellii.AAC.1